VLKRWFSQKQSEPTEPSAPAGPAGPARSTIFLRGVAYHLEEIAPIERIPALAADATLLAAFKAAGNTTYAHSNQSLAEQAIASAKKTLAAASLVAADINAVVIGTSEIREPKRYPEMLSTEVLAALGLSDVPLVGVTLAGCANYSSALRVARNLLVAEGMKHVLVIETDQVRGSMQRQVFDNGAACAIFGDGAASLVVSSDTPSLQGSTTSDFELVALAQTIRPLDWSTADVNAIAANNYFGFLHVVNQAMAHAGATRSDVAKAFFSNISVAIVGEFAALLELDMKRVHTANCSRTAHVWSCDNLINLVDHCATEQVPKGALFLLVSQAESFFSAIVCRKT
jgi:3-oxoacyl-[acyl-carrier-protein] synthase III